LDKNSRIFELLKPEPVGKLLENHRSGRQDNHKLLFSLVLFEHWLREVLSNGEQQESR
jgi:asparagine synthase (glutamine-hydrolysing)